MTKRKTKNNISTFFLVFLFLIIMLAVKYLNFTLGLLFIWLLSIIIIRWIKWKKIHNYKLSDIDNMKGLEFEHYISKLLKNEGFSKIEVTQGSNDFGVDILAFLDNESYAIQVKRYSKNVSRTAVSDAISGKDFYECNKAMVITNNYFTKGAIEMADTLDCTLVDKDTLIEWIYKFNRLEKKWKTLN